MFVIRCAWEVVYYGHYYHTALIVSHDQAIILLLHVYGSCD